MGTKRTTKSAATRHNDAQITAFLLNRLEHDSGVLFIEAHHRYPWVSDTQVGGQRRGHDGHNANALTNILFLQPVLLDQHKVNTTYRAYLLGKSPSCILSGRGPTHPTQLLCKTDKYILPVEASGEGIRRSGPFLGSLFWGALVRSVCKLFEATQCPSGMG